MALYRVMVGLKEYSVDVSDKGVRVNGEPVEQARLTPLNAGGLFLLERGDRRREFHVDPQSGSQFAFLVEGRHIIAQVEKATRRLRKAAEAHRVGDLLAPMPAVVVNVPVQEGQAVNAGQLLVVLESMKMQMDFRSPVAGTVKKVLVQPGSSVSKGALMVQVE